MATRSDEEAVSSSLELRMADLSALYEALFPVRSKYKFFALQIGVEVTDIRDIEANHAGTANCLLEILSTRLSQVPALTCTDIVNALRSRSVGEHQIADHFIDNFKCTAERTEIKKAKRDKYVAKKSKESTTNEKRSSKERSDKFNREAKIQMEKNSEGRYALTMYESNASQKRKAHMRGKPLIKTYESEQLETGKQRKQKINKMGKDMSNPKPRYNPRNRPILETVAPDTESENEEESSLFEIPHIKESSIKQHLLHREVGAAVDSDEDTSERYIPKSKGEEELTEESSATTSDKNEGDTDDTESEDPHSRKGKAQSFVLKKTRLQKRPQKGGVKASLHAALVVEQQPSRSREESESFYVKEMQKKNIDIHKADMQLKENVEEIERQKKNIPLPKKGERVVFIHPEQASDQSESDSDDESDSGNSSSENQEDIEEEFSEEEKKTETDEESSTTNEEEDVKLKPWALLHERVEKKKEWDERKTFKQRIVSEAAVKAFKSQKIKGMQVSDVKFHSPGEFEESDPAQSSREHEPQKKGKFKIKCKESSISPSVIGSSFPYTSKEKEKQCAYKKKGKRKKHVRKSKEKIAQKLKCASGSPARDDSSLESDKVNNKSEGDLKQLVNVFECFFGQLCCVEFNPIDISAKLLKKALISKATMKNMMLSPESQQARIISLLDELSEVIKARPECLFLCIEVMLENDALKETAREILKEAGAVCPIKTAAKFPFLLTTPDSTISLETEGIGNKVRENESDLARDHHPELIPNPSDITLPQSVPFPPMLVQYKRYLQSCYKAKVLAPTDKYLPTLQAPYINLAMIRRGLQGCDKGDEFTMKTLHGGVDQILASKTPIKITDLLVTEESKEPVKFILVEGPPGIGKSTFAWEICRKWEEVESLRKYHTVVLLKLRERWVLNATKLSDLFRYPPDPELSAAIAKGLNESQGRSLLLVLDGFDEISHSFHDNSVIKSILCRQLLPECTIILTTRPSAKHMLQCVCQPQVDKHIEIIGFTEEERVRYITAVFRKQPELQANFLKYMFHVPHMKSMMYIPLNCAIIAQVYCESQHNSHYLAMPKTRTQLYKALTHSLLLRHMRMKEDHLEGTHILPEGLNKEDMKNFQVLAEFAFNAYHMEGSSRKVTFFKEDIPEGFVHFGFMNESTELYASKGVEQIFSFLHLSLQEYLAAWHLANSYTIEFQVAYHSMVVWEISERKMSKLMGESPEHKGCDEDEESLLLALKSQRHSLQLQEPALFLAGITGFIWQFDDDHVNHWEEYISDYSKTNTSNWMVICSLYEAQNATLSTFFAPESISFGDLYTDEVSKPYECYALSYCLAHHSNQFSLSIYIDDYNSGSSFLEAFVKGLEDHCISTTPKVKHLEIDARYASMKITNECLFWLMDTKFMLEVEELNISLKVLNSALVRFIQSFVNLQSLVLESEQIASYEWLAALDSLRKLRELHISSSGECTPPPVDLQFFSERPRLTHLVVDIKVPFTETCALRSSNDVLVGCLVKSLVRSTQITEAHLQNISRETMADVRSILLHCPSLVALQLKSTRLGYDGILYICSALRDNTRLSSLLIHSQVPESHNYGRLTSFVSTKRVTSPADKTTCTDFLLELNNILKENSTLELMDIQSGLFLPLSAGGHEYQQWTGLGCLQQFNLGAVGSERPSNLKRSYSTSHLTQPQALLFWDLKLPSSTAQLKINFTRLFSKKKQRGRKLFSLPSFTAPDTDIVRSFSGLDPRLQQCLRVSYLNHHHYLNGLRRSYNGMILCKGENSSLLY